MATASSASTRERLLTAGRELLVEIDVNILTSGLLVEHVAERAGLSTQTFYNIYPRRSESGVVGGKAAFLDELLSSLLPRRESDIQQRVQSELINRSAEASGDPRRIIRDVCRWDFERVRDSPETQLRFVVCAVAADHREAVARIQSHYNDIVHIANETNSGMLRAWSASLRQPFTLDRLAVVLSALVEGLVLRSRFDPDAVPSDLFGEAVVALLGSIIDIDQTHGHIDDVMAPLAEAAIKSYQLAHTVELPDDPEQAIIDSARLEFGQRGYFATERAQIAGRAGVDLETLRYLFPSNVDIVVAGLKPAYDALQKRIAVDTRLRRTPLSIIQRYGVRFAELIAENRSFFDAMALVISLQTAQAPVNATRIREELFFPGLVVDAFTEGQAHGVLNNGVAAIELASTYTNNIIFRCLSRRDESADSIISVIDLIFFQGLLSRPAASGPPHSLGSSPPG